MNIIDDEEQSYRQIVFEITDQDSLKIRRVDYSFTHRFDLLTLLFLLLLISSTDAMPLRVQSPLIYRANTNPIQTSYYSNAGQVQIINPNRMMYPSMQDEQYRRERQRRMMVEKLFRLFDEDGNGQLTNDEFYSMALRSNIFPKIHSYFRQNTN